MICGGLGGFDPPFCTGQRLHDVVRSTLVAGLIYSSSSWWGFAGAADRGRLQAVYTDENWPAGYLPENVPSIEHNYLLKGRQGTFCLGRPQLGSRDVSPFAPRKESMHALRPRVHGRVLPEADHRKHRSFLTRMLYFDYSCE